MMTTNTTLNGRSTGFKKKTSTAGTESINTKPVDKFSDLKSKLQKEKEMMKKTGKRFREDTTASTHEISISTENSNNQSENTKHDISIGPEQPTKQTISLKDISLSDRSTGRDSLISSQLFEREVKEQKKRSTEVYEFLRKIELQAFAEGLIAQGFDELESLVDLTTEDLNLLMMRAHQQIRLLDAIKQLKVKLGSQSNKSAIKQQLSNTSALWRIKTQPMQNPSQTPRIQSSQILTRLKTEHKNAGKQPQQSGLKPGSFLFSVGSKYWSTEDQVRRACSVCYKVQQQMEKKGECYYCGKCWKFVSEDVLQIEIGRSLNREYRKLEKE